MSPMQRMACSGIALAGTLGDDLPVTLSRTLPHADPTFAS
jgi:hypothetical protein